jgi:hypothetical protein
MYPGVDGRGQVFNTASNKPREPAATVTKSSLTIQISTEEELSIVKRVSGIQSPDGTRTSK